MKTYLRLGLLAAALSVAAYASDQPAAPPPPAPGPGAEFAPGQLQPRGHHRARLAVFANQLGLTADQKTSLKAIGKQTEASVKAVRANTALTPEQQRTQIVALRDAARTQMRALLTPEQQAKFDDLTSHPRRMHAMVQHRERMAALADKLGLTDAQRARIADIRKATHASIQPILANQELTHEQKFAKVRDLREAARQEVRGVLTPAQQEQFDQLRERVLERWMPLG